jgi:hypothetical protein
LHSVGQLLRSVTAGATLQKDFALRSGRRHKLNKYGRCGHVYDEEGILNSEEKVTFNYKPAVFKVLFIRVQIKQANHWLKFIIGLFKINR